MPCDSHARSDVALNVLAGTKQPGGPGWGRHWKRRLTVLLIVQALIIAHIVVWWIGVPLGWKTVAPVEPSEAIETVSEGIINAGFIFFVLALLSTAIFGRWFCGWGCHVMLLQDWCLRLMRRMGIRPRAFRSRLLMWAPLVLALYMFVWPIVYRLVIAPFTRPDVTWHGFRVEILTNDLWATMPGVGVAVVFLLICGFATVYVLGGKGFCTYACPYGGFFAPLDRIAPRRVRVNDDCEGCAMCTVVCTSNVRVHEEVAAYGMVTDPGCMKTTDCIEACPKQALSIGWGPTAIGASVRPESQAPRPQWDLTWTGEVTLALLMLVLFLIWRGAYGLVPLLMAGGLVAVLTWLFWKAVMTVQSDNASLHRWRLRIEGRTTRVGGVFMAIAVLCAVLTLQAGASQVFALWGNITAADRLQMPIDAPPRPGVETLSGPDLDMAQRAVSAFTLAGGIADGGIGLASDPNDLRAKGRLQARMGQVRAAQRTMARVAALSRPNESLTRERFMLEVALDPPPQVAAWVMAQLEGHPEWIHLATTAAQWAASRGDLIAAAAFAQGPEADKYRALAALQVGNVPEARTALVRYLDAAPGDGLAWMMLAEVDLALGDLPGATAAADAARGCRDEMPPEAVGDLQSALDRFDAAVERLRRQ